MSRLWRAWVDLLSVKEPATSLALFRIFVGVCVIWLLGAVVRADLVDVIWVDRAYGGLRTLHPTALVDLLGGATPRVAWGLTITGLVSGAMLAVGLGGRVTAFVALQCVQGLTDSNGQSSGSYDELICNALWLLVLGNATATWSADCRLRTGSWRSDREISAWPRYLAILQAFLMYWTTGLQKLSAYWTPGGDFSALYYILQQPSWQRFDLSFMAWLFPLTQVATAVTWCWEVGAPLFLLAYYYRYTADRPGRVRAWFNRVDARTIYVLVGLTFHVLIFIPMDVGPFSPISLSYYACFYSPDELASGLRRLRALAGRVAPARIPEPG